MYLSTFHAGNPAAAGYVRPVLQVRSLRALEGISFVGEVGQGLLVEETRRAELFSQVVGNVRGFGG
jgi:hypothetical protein